MVTTTSPGFPPDCSDATTSSSVSCDAGAPAATLALAIEVTPVATTDNAAPDGDKSDRSGKSGASGRAAATEFNAVSTSSNAAPTAPQPDSNTNDNPTPSTATPRLIHLTVRAMNQSARNTAPRNGAPAQAGTISKERKEPAVGMDLIAVNPATDDTASYHVNWTGWTTLRDLLLELGCDITTMAGGNDGDTVPADTAAQWGTTIKNNLHRIVIERYPSTRYAGGYYERYRVEGSATPQILGTAEQINALIGLAHSGTVNTSSEHSDTAPDVTRLTDDPAGVAWLTGFATFCQASGGFHQY